MNRKLKKTVKNDFINKTNVNFSFDVSTLPLNEKRRINVFRLVKNIAIISACCIIAIIIAHPIASSIDINQSVNKIQKKYSLNELKLIEESSFKPLNEITYPTTLQRDVIDEEFVNAMKDFTYDIYNINDSINDFSFAPINLYSNLAIMSLACNNDEVNLEFDNLLKINKDKRNKNFIKMYKNNFFVNDNGTTQMYNSVFLTNKYQVNMEFINSLTSNHAEAYQVDFQSNIAVNKMLSWIDQKLKEENFLKKEDLQINEDSMMYIFSTLYFDNKWANSFVNSYTYNETFYIDKNNTKDVMYMNHTYHGTVYDYDKYVSAYDYYYNGYKIQYVVPKSLDDNIFELTKNINFLKEDENYYRPNSIIELSLPKFTTESFYNFSDTIKKLGFTKAFDETYDSFNYAFDDVNLKENVYLDFIKQKNKISFNEDGTIIKSVVFSGMGKGTSIGPSYNETYQITLNQPFIYVIYDNSNIPLYVGKVIDPKY